MFLTHRHSVHGFLTLALLTTLFLSPLRAQENKCLPPITLPVSTEPNIFTEEQEVYLGDAIAEHIQRNFRVIEDPEVTAYLIRIGDRLAQHLPLTKLRFQFFLVDLPNANAFVLPGGRIFVSRKLVALTRDEDELAGVISHELGHLVTHESAISLTRQLSEVLGARQVSDRRDIFEKYNQLIENYRRKPEAFKARDREHGQMAADQAGFYALLAAGYDPGALARFWDRLTETKGKTGSWFSDFFGTIRPDERRLREMLKVVNALPPECRKKNPAPTSELFKEWQAAVISYTGLGRREALRGVVQKLQLTPPLRSDITHLRFSPDGRHVLAQDDSGINVLTRNPFTPLFRIDAPDARPAMFSPNSQNIVFATDNLRVEKWGLAEQKEVDVKEVVILKGCLQSALSPDGKFLACLNVDFDLNVLDVATGQKVIQRKEFFRADYFHLLYLIYAQRNRRSENGDAGLDLVNMSFSPDARFFVAGFLGPDNMKSSGSLAYVEGFELATLKKISLSDATKQLIIGGFSFMGNDRLIGTNYKDKKEAVLVSFPEGEVLDRFKLHGRVEAPTRGEYLLIRPIKDFPVGVMDLKTKVIFKSNKQPAIDIYGDEFVAEMRNGELGLYRMEKSQIVATTLLSNFNLGRLNVAEMSPDMKWLAISGRSRGGVWNLGKNGEAALYLRGFRGAHLSNQGEFFADFPKYETAERNVARFSLATGEVAPGPKIEAYAARQAGQYLIITRLANENAKETDVRQYGKNVKIEVLDARTMNALWTKPYPKEAPRLWAAPQHDTAALVWDITDEAAKVEIKQDARLTQQLTLMKEKEGDYLVQVLDLPTGNTLGKLLVETGKGSFRLQNVFAAGAWVVVTDTQNRVLVYSLKTGAQLGRVFGTFPTIAPKTGLLCVENEVGKLAVYDIATMDKRDEFTFSSPIAMLRFSPNGQRLIVLTSNQILYEIDVSKTGLAAAVSRLAN